MYPDIEIMGSEVVARVCCDCDESKPYTEEFWRRTVFDQLPLEQRCKDCADILDQRPKGSFICLFSILIQDVEYLKLAHTDVNPHAQLNKLCEQYDDVVLATWTEGSTAQEKELHKILSNTVEPVLWQEGLYPHSQNLENFATALLDAL